MGAGGSDDMLHVEPPVGPSESARPRDGASGSDIWEAISCGGRAYWTTRRCMGGSDEGRRCGGPRAPASEVRDPDDRE